MVSKWMYPILLFITQCSADMFDFSPFIDETEANNILKRDRRSNRFSIIEEFSQGNQERECIEEVCTQEEAYEVYDNLVKGREFWGKYTRCKISPITKTGDLNYVPSREEEARIRIARRAESDPNEWDKQMLRDCIADTDQCTPFPCVLSNTERCEDRINAYECFCKLGFTGSRCEQHVNECLSEPCGNFGTCEDEVAGFQCHCDDRHEGIVCEKEIADCRISDCGRGKCLLNEEVETYSCVCDKGYRGEECGQDIDECMESSPCEHGCQNTNGGFTCSCNDGYNLDVIGGTKCKDINECQSLTHGCEGICLNTKGSYQCLCQKGFKLDTEFGRSCEDIDECAENNGGCPIIESGCGLNREPCKTCQNLEGEFYCSCPKGFTKYVRGGTCEDINECTTGLGRNCEQQCENYPGGYRCLCRDGYKLNFNRKNCLDINECILEHGCGYRCSNKPGGYECICRRGYILDVDGRRCIDDDECSKTQSQCSQICLNTEGSYKCDCQPGYRLVGKYRCSDINECISAPCGRNGRCVNEVNSFSCECDEGFTGRLCDVIMHPCANGPCQNDAICTEDGLNFTCQCVNGFTDELCQTPAPEELECDPGYGDQGSGCVDVNECEETTICAQTCNNIPGSYSCSCDDGYIANGDQCDEIDECQLGACEQLCENRPGYFICSCLDGYTLNADAITCARDFACVGSSYSVLQEEHLLLGVNRSDFVINEIQTMPSRFTLDFEFRTFDRDGVLLAISDAEAHRYIYIVMKDGKLIFGANMDGSHHEVGDSKDEDHSTANGIWHRVIIRKRKNRITVLHDQHKLPGIKFTRSRFETDNFIYYGGIPSSSSLAEKIATDLYLQGCIRRIQHTGIKLRASQSSGHSGCFENIGLQTGTYFDGTGYLLLNAALIGDLHMRFTFKTTSGNGRIVTAIGRNGIMYTLTIEGFKVLAEVVNAEGQSSTAIYSAPSDRLLCDNVWHVCDFTVSSNKIRLHVDGLAAQQKDIANMRDVTFENPFPLYLGGYPDDSTKSFEGSLQNIKVNNKPLDLNGPIYIAGVRTHSIPSE